MSIEFIVLQCHTCIKTLVTKIIPNDDRLGSLNSGSGCEVGTKVELVGSLFLARRENHDLRSDMSKAVGNTSA